MKARLFEPGDILVAKCGYMKGDFPHATDIEEGELVRYEFDGATMDNPGWHYVRTIDRETHVVGAGTLGFNVQLELLEHELYDTFELFVPADQA